LELGTWDFFGVWSLDFGVSIPELLWSLDFGVSLSGDSKTEMRPLLWCAAFFQCISPKTWLGFCPGETKFNQAQAFAWLARGWLNGGWARRQGRDWTNPASQSMLTSEDYER